MKEDIHKHYVLILDFGSQYTYLLAKRIRNLGVYCEICLYNELTLERICKFTPKGIILSGGPKSIAEKDSPRAPEYIFEIGIPILGICYGMHAMTVQLGGSAEFSNKREFGSAQLEIVQPYNNLISGIKDFISPEGKFILNVWMSHTDSVTKIPSNFTVVASNKTCQFSIIANEERHFYGVQFHPEVTHTTQGLNILKRFIFDICKCQALWTSIKILDDIIIRISKQIGKDKVLLALSGGIDSFVTAVLLHRVIGKNLTCIFIDNGLLRLNEAQQVINMFQNYLGMNVNIISIRREKRFLKSLIGKTDPEEKRKIIGLVFIEILQEEALKLQDIKWLAQGTIYPDVIESTSTISDKKHIIKSHHNVGGLPKKVHIKLIEPLRELFKDEVRKVGVELGIPNEILYRHPFPGPGLAVRILGEIKKEYCDLLRNADAIFIEELRKSGLYNKVSQAFAVFLPIRSVGIAGDCRIYSWVISLRAIKTIDYMSANWAILPYDFLDYVSNRIINEVTGVSRVVYDITGKPPATIEWE